MTPASEPANSRIEKRVLIKANPSIVYHALTDAHDLVRWFCDRASSDPQVGGELAAYWRKGKNGQRGRAVYVRAEPNLAVELLWIDDGSGPDPDNAHHRITYSIRTTRQRDTEVVMRDEDNSPSANAEVRAILEEGWNTVLLELKDFCERRERSGKTRQRSDE
jgi:uncharacterized protein YndB with AHSA1/START domain